MPRRVWGSPFEDEPLSALSGPEAQGFPGLPSLRGVVRHLAVFHLGRVLLRPSQRARR